MASKINHIIFDKTGTLTKGKPFIVDYKNNTDHSFLLRIAASLEKESRHPIADALIEEAKKQNISLFPIKKIFTHSGRGCLLYTSPSPRDPKTSRMPSSA